MNIVKFSTAAALAVFLLAGCNDEQIEQIRDNIENDLYEDPDFSGQIVFPETVNSECPNWGKGQTITLQESVTLPANCSFERVTLLIDRPNIELDCNQAVFNGLSKVERNRYGEPYSVDDQPSRYGLIIQGRENATESVSNVTIRNCQFLNYTDAMTAQMNLSRATLLGLRDGSITEASIQAIAPTNISVLDSKLVNSHMHGIFLNRYVTYLNVERTRILGSGNSAIYLGADTENALINQSSFQGNGFSSYEISKRTRSARRTELSRREAIAVDSASYNRITNNVFRDNGDGGVYLYKNCWEYEEQPYTAPHRFGSNGNTISNNRFLNEETAVWVAERADRDLASFTCGDPLLYQENDRKYYRDIAQNNIISNNYFGQNKQSVRIQDDNNTVTNNTFVDTKTGPDIKVYSRIREKVGDPVKNTTISGNVLSKPDGVSYENGAN